MAETARVAILKGTLLGQMAGDAMGLPWEGLPPRLIPKGAPKHSLLLGRGMVSDDTEHALMTIASLNEALDRDEPVARFERRLRGRLVSWILAAPPSLGRTTLLAGIRAAGGVRDCGLASLGNGPLMRAPAIGAAVADPGLRRNLTEASTRMTHIDAIVSDCAIAAADAVAAAASGIRATAWLDAYEPQQRIVRDRMRELARGAERGESVARYAALVLPNERKGVPGTSLLTLLAALKCWSAHPRDFEGGVAAAIGLGGDTDTVAALTGALIGAGVGKAGIPAAWLDGIADVYSPRRIEQACAGESAMPNWALRAARNGAQFCIVVGHAAILRPIRYAASA